MVFLMRIALPDKPGTLAAVATSLVGVKANIVSLHVVDVEEGIAVDDLIVEMPQGTTEALRGAVDGVAGAVVERVAPADALPDPMAPMELAAALASHRGDAVETLVRGLPAALSASWSCVLRIEDGLEILASSTGSPPSLIAIETPWMPLDGARRLPEALWMPPAWRMQRYELAAAPFFHADSAVLVARSRGPRFRSSELRQLELLIHITCCVQEADTIVRGSNRR